MLDTIIISEHAREKMLERGIDDDDVRITIEHGEHFTAKYGRFGFRRNFVYLRHWQNRFYSAKQVSVITVKEENTYLVVTVIAKYF
jgi:hypothetical protein